MDDKFNESSEEELDQKDSVESVQSVVIVDDNSVQSCMVAVKDIGKYMK